MTSKINSDPICGNCAQRGDCPDVAFEYLKRHINYGKDPEHLDVLFGFKTPQEANSALGGIDDQREMCKTLPPEQRGGFDITREHIGRLAMPPDPEL